jgi:hypothetical protein
MHSLSRQTENLRENIPTPEKFSTESNATRTRKSEPVYLNLTNFAFVRGASGSCHDQ